MLIHDHEALFPPSQNCKIWRYLDFTKYVSLLETKKLFFPRADQFDDPYEGTWSSAGVRLSRNSSDRRFSAEVVDALIAQTFTKQEEMFISCWHVNEHESAAMWKLYLQSKEGVAICTDYQTLANIFECAPLNIGISRVQYIDYDKTPIPFGNWFFPFIHKRSSFEHEKELRAVVWAGEAINAPQIIKGSMSVSVGVSVGELVKSVHVSPAAEPWFGSLVGQVTRNYGVQAPVIRSGLYDRPVL